MLRVIAIAVLLPALVHEGAYAQGFTFQVELSPSESVVRQGGIGGFTYFIIIRADTPSLVSIDISDQPPGTFAAASPNACTPTCSGVIQISTRPDTLPGRYRITVTGSTAEFSASASATLVVEGLSPPPPKATGPPATTRGLPPTLPSMVVPSIDYKLLSTGLQTLTLLMAPILLLIPIALIASTPQWKRACKSTVGGIQHMEVILRRVWRRRLRGWLRRLGDHVDRVLSA